MKKVGIFGGTFDPVHIGHLRAAEEVREGVGLEEVWFVPAGQPPHKTGRRITPFEVRFKMLTLAVRDNPFFKVLDIEGREPSPSYTLNTLLRLKEEFPENEFFFILGADAFLEIHTWYRYQEIPRHCTLVVVTREGISFGEMERQKREVFNGELEEKVVFFEVTRLEVSSSLVREMLSEGRSVRYLLPEEVLELVEELGLYRRD